jgi:2-polyprenyl-3-methyl-5-hydroxy-6-metoxy-1,4-benzoquinol methylase
MNFKELKAFVKRQVEKLPIGIQKIVFATAMKVRYFVFGLKLTLIPLKGIPNPERIFWISPDRIVYNTNYLKNSAAKAKHFAGRVFDSKLRGKVVGGNWDITPYKFTELIVYKSFKKRIEDRAEWQDTEFYKVMLEQANSGLYFWGVKSKDDLDKRCEYFDSLIESIKNDGYRLNRYDEIEVNIGRNGEYLFQNGVHRLSIAKILGIKSVPIMVFVRHKEWQKFREFVVSYAKQQKRGRLYQAIVHPDLADIPYYDLEGHNCEDIMRAIKLHLGPEKGVMLDIGANIGFFCHKFEDLGYHCYAVESEPIVFRILERMKIAENKKFEVINKSIFDVELIRKMKFDVVLALNVFHHFLKTKTEFIKLQDLLKNLEMDQMFFEAHRYDDGQMKNAFINYTQPEFVEFILQRTSLNKSEVIYTAKNGRTIFKLSKQV